MRRYGSREGRRWSLVMELISLLDMMVDLGKMPGGDPTGSSPSSELLAQTGHGGDQTGYMTVPKREMQSLSGKGLHLQAHPSHPTTSIPLPVPPTVHLPLIAHPSNSNTSISLPIPTTTTSIPPTTTNHSPLPITPTQTPPCHCPSFPGNHLHPIAHPSHLITSVQWSIPPTQPPEPHLVLPTGPSPHGVTHAGATLSPLSVPPPTFYGVPERSTREPRCQMGPTVAKLGSYIINHCPKLCQLCICDG